MSEVSGHLKIVTSHCAILLEIIVNGFFLYTVKTVLLDLTPVTFTGQVQKNVLFQEIQALFGFCLFVCFDSTGDCS